MTIAEIKDFTDWEDRATRRYIAKAAIIFPSILEKGRKSKSTKTPADYSLDETCEILRAGGFGGGVLRWLRRFVEDHEEKQRLLSESTGLRAKMALLPPPVSELMTIRDYMAENNIPLPISQITVFMRRVYPTLLDIDIEIGATSGTINRDGYHFWFDCKTHERRALAELFKRLEGRDWTVVNRRMKGHLSNEKVFSKTDYLPT